MPKYLCLLLLSVLPLASSATINIPSGVSPEGIHRRNQDKALSTREKFKLIPQKAFSKHLTKKTDKKYTQADFNYDLDRIINGLSASIKDYPYLGSIFASLDDTFSKGNVCGGSLISPNIVLTAAHCLINDNTTIHQPNRIEITFGSNLSDFNNNGTFGVSKTVIHPKYNNRTFTNDIGIMFLSSDVPSDVATPAKIFTEKIDDNLPVAVSGWGITENNPNAQVSKSLNYVNINISSAPFCKTLNPDWDGNNGLLICTNTNSGKTMCKGDSGGPLSILNIESRPIVGIVSHGRSIGTIPGDVCRLTNGAGFYTGVGTFIDWISKETGLSKDSIIYKGLSKNTDSTNSKNQEQNISNHRKKGTPFFDRIKAVEGLASPWNDLDENK